MKLTRTSGLIICFTVLIISLGATTTMHHPMNSVDYDQLKLKSYKHWDVYLHENQCYLGRVFIQLKENEKIEDFLDIDGEVRDEFFQVGEQVKNALNILFQPDKMNYAALSNTSPVIHVHFVPRYKEPRDFAGMTFRDIQWGKNYAPYDKSFTTDEETLFRIRDALKEALELKIL